MFFTETKKENILLLIYYILLKDLFQDFQEAY